MAEPDYTSPEVIERERQALFDFDRNFSFFKLLGMQLLEVEPGRAKMSLTFRDDLTQPAGILHGGAIASLIDTSVAHSLLLTEPYLASKESGGRMISVDLRVKYVRPVSQGTIYSEARVPRLGKQIIHTNAVVTDDEGREVAYGDSIYMFLSLERLRRKEK